METGLARLDLEAGRTDGKVVESDNRLRFGVDFTMVATADFSEDEEIGESGFPIFSAEVTMGEPGA